MRRKRAPIKRHVPEHIVTAFRSKPLRSSGECLEWLGGTSSNYGVFRNFFAHRVAYFAAYGELPPEEMVIRHTCNNKLCCNPVHLVAGTHGENRADKLRTQGFKEYGA